MASESENKAKVLVVDDEFGARSALTELLREEGYRVRSAADGYKALGQLEDWTPDLIITDVKMPGLDGIGLMKQARERLSGVGVVVMTAFGSVDHAVEAMHEGADDYLTKPVRFDELLVVVQRVLQHYSVCKENAELRTALEEESSGDGIEWVGQSNASRELMSLVRQVAGTDASVLIEGESGTGKELVARALQSWGGRCEAPFVTVPCSAANELVLESDLFGHESGALLGATSQRDGKLLKANGGTLFLDEVAELPLSTQAKLLRFLQDGEFERVGGDDALRADVRVVAATRRDLHEEVSAGRFREDLYYRLNVITLRMPTLRQRRDDIAPLAMHFLKRHNRKSGPRIRGFSDRALRVIGHFDWPGNVRQLENCVERAIALCQGAEIEPKHLPAEVRGKAKQSEEMPQIPGASMAELERFAILKTLEHVRGSTGKAAEILGISPRKIQYRLAEYRDFDPSGIAAVTGR